MSISTDAGPGGTAIAGNQGTAIAGREGTATAGREGTAIAGPGGTAAAGINGVIQVHWHDGDRFRVAVGYVGEDGIDPDVAYRCCDTTGRLVRAEQ